MNHNFILYPALSSGFSKFYLMNNTKLQYYNDNKIDYPYMLLSAGHNVNFLNLRNDLNLNNTKVLGDSGGFQIFSESKSELEIDIKNTLIWLEKNCDIGINLDIPENSINDFEYSLSHSKNNFEYFQNNRSGKIELLNVLHGRSKEEIKTWYDTVKDFEFDGWAISDYKLDYIDFTLDLIINSSSKTKLKYIHYLGISDLNLIKVLILNQIKYPEIQFSTDSSFMSKLASENIKINSLCDNTNIEYNNSEYEFNLLYNNIIKSIEFIKYWNKNIIYQ